jgi:type VI secretion system protein ImpG
VSDVQHSDVLQYYKRELTYLREQGADFSRRYPKVASRLAFHGSESIDPHTELLIESVAFLAARVHRDLDREFPQVAAALLDNLCPSLVQPLPSMSVVQFQLDPTQGKVTAGYQIPRHTILYATAGTGEQCRFRTAWDTVLWPLRVAKAALQDRRSLRLTLECVGDTDFSELEVDRLRVHLEGDWMTAMPLYELLVSGVDQLPTPAHAQPAYGLMQEYFAFPRKFHFFELRHLRGRLGKGRRCDVVLHLATAARGLRSVDADNFALGCTPIANLFPRTSEPIVIDHKHYEYLLVGDRQREASTEVHSVLSVVASEPSADRPVLVPSFAALGHIAHEKDAIFWSARREHSLRPDISGTDLFLTFVDQANTMKLPSEPVIYAQLLCTNRRLAEQVPAGARMVAEGVSQATGIRCLYEPTVQHSPPLGSETLWRLVSLLTLSHQSLVDGSTGRDQLREMLTLFASDSTRDHEQIRGIKSLVARGVTARIGNDAWRGYCRGTEVALEFDDQGFVGGSPLMLAAVLARFFAMYTSVNSFVRLVAYRGDEIWKQWEPMSGRQLVL